MVEKIGCVGIDESDRLKLSRAKIVSVVSVIIPAYNGADYIESALRSVCSQSQPPAECIVVDDASNDNSGRLVEEWINKSATKIRLLRLNDNSGGPARPLNVGIEAAEGDQVAVLDQDDVFEPERIETLSRVMVRHPEVGCVASPCSAIDNRGRPIATRFQSTKMLRRLATFGRPGDGCSVIDGRLAGAALLVHGNYVIGYSGFMFRKIDWQQCGGLDESMRVASDYDFLCRLLQQKPLAWVPQKLFRKRVHSQNLSAREMDMLSDMLRATERHAGEFRPAGDDESTRKYLQELFSGRLVCLSWVGAHADAIDRLQQCLRRQGWNRELPRTFAKVLCYRLRDFFRKPRPNAHALGQLHAKILQALWELTGPLDPAETLTRRTVREELPCS